RKAPSPAWLSHLGFTPMSSPAARTSPEQARFSRNALVLGLALLASSADLSARVPENFVRGDADRSEIVDVSDAVHVLTYLFLGGSPGPCLDAMDVDDSGDVDLSDAVALLGFLFLGGAVPRSPFPEPGRDDTLDELICSSVAPPGGEGPLLAAELESWLAEPLADATLVSTAHPGGDDRAIIEVTPQLLDLLEGLESGESLLDHLDGPGVADLVKRIEGQIPPEGAPVALPRSICVAAGPDGCHTLDPELLRGRSRDTDRSPRPSELSLEIDPPVVCGPGEHIVRVVVRDTSGLESLSSAMVTLCGPEDSKCLEGCSPEEEPEAPAVPSPFTCFWLWSGRLNPARRVFHASAVSFGEDGRVKSRREGADVHVGGDPMELSMKGIGPGPRHHLVGARYGATCSMPATDYVLQTTGEITLRLNLRCFDRGLAVIPPPCASWADVEGRYQGFATLATFSREACRGRASPVEALAQEECSLYAGGRSLFQKALALQRGNVITREMSLVLGADVGILRRGIAASIQAKRGVSVQVIDRTGRAEGTLRGFAATRETLPLTAQLVAAGRAEIKGSGVSEGSAGAVTEVGALYALGVTTCPCRSPFLALGRVVGRGRPFLEALESADDFFFVRTGRRDLDWKRR
ncbi:MAG: hypothetical protein O7J95_06885, partial [Planctomycetota bacterium]|nr:hypothetical protein [Planctomycetota bacterium]